YHLPILLGLAAAPLTAAAVGVVTGLVAQRAVRLYFSLLTLAISQLLFSLAFTWYDFTGGDNGIAVTVPDQLSDYTTLYYFTAAVVGVCLLLMFLLVRSPFGAALLSIRENRQFPDHFDIILGAIVLGVVLAVPGGISDAPTVFLRLRERFHRGEQAEAPPAESAGEAIRMFDVRKALATDAIQAEEVHPGQTLL